MLPFLSIRVRHCSETSHLHADLDGLPVATLGVRDALCVVLAVVNHRLVVPGLLLQREDDASDVHVAVRKKRPKGDARKFKYCTFLSFLTFCLKHC